MKLEVEDIVPIIKEMNNKITAIGLKVGALKTKEEKEKVKDKK